MDMPREMEANVEIKSNDRMPHKEHVEKNSKLFKIINSIINLKILGIYFELLLDKYFLYDLSIK